MTGNDFLEQYPFGKKIEEMSDYEFGKKAFYDGYIEGWVMSNAWTLQNYNIFLPPDWSWYGDEKLLMRKRMPEAMTINQSIRLLKKFLDENPLDTHKNLGTLIGEMFDSELPRRKQP